jgi:WD40 repeat protein
MAAIANMGKQPVNNDVGKTVFNKKNAQRHTKQEPPPPQFVLRSGEIDVSALAFLKYPYLVSGTVSGTMKIWSLTNRRVKHESIPHSGLGILKLELIYQYKIEKNIIFLSHGRDGYVKMWKLNLNSDSNDVGVFELEELRSIQNGSFAYCKISVYENYGKNYTISLVAPGREDDEFLIYSISDTDTNQRTSIKHVTMSSNSFHLISGINSSSETNNRKKGMIMCINMIDESSILIGYESGEISVYDLENKTCTSIAIGHAESVLCMDFAVHKVIKDKVVNTNATARKSHYQFRGFSGGADSLLVVYKLCQRTLNLNIQNKIKIPFKGIADIKIRRHHFIEATNYKYKIVLCACWDGKVRIYGFKNVRLLASLSYHEGSVYNISCPYYIPCRDDNQTSRGVNTKDSSDSNFKKDFKYGLFATSGKDGRIACWELYGDNYNKKIKV